MMCFLRIIVIVLYNTSGHILEKAMAPHSLILAWKIPWMEEHGAGYSPWDRKESGTTE